MCKASYNYEHETVSDFIRPLRHVICHHFNKYAAYDKNVVEDFDEKFLHRINVTIYFS